MARKRNKILKTGQYLYFRDDDNESRLETFTVRSDYDDGWAKILTPLLLPVSQMYDLAMFWRLRLQFLTGSGKYNHSKEVSKIQVSLVKHKLKHLHYLSARSK